MLGNGVTAMTCKNPTYYKFSEIFEKIIDFFDTEGYSIYVSLTFILKLKGVLGDESCDYAIMVYPVDGVAEMFGQKLLELMKKYKYCFQHTQIKLLRVYQELVPELLEIDHPLPKNMIRRSDGKIAYNFNK